MIQKIFEELIAMQEKKLLEMGTKIIPTFTTDDMLQPNDFRELENNPYFRYEEGILEGLRTAQVAINNLPLSPFLS